MSIDQEVKKVNDERLAALAAGDVKKLDQFLSDGLTYMTAGGITLNKAQILSAVASGDFKVASFDTDGFKVTQYRDTAVAVYRTTMTSSFKGQNRAGQYGTTSVYVKQGERWRLAAQQMTLLPPPLPTPGGMRKLPEPSAH